jgi:hypothetical protein
VPSVRSSLASVVSVDSACSDLHSNLIIISFAQYLVIGLIIGVMRAYSCTPEDVVVLQLEWNHHLQQVLPQMEMPKNA